jgi:hypothetical protein
MALSCNRAPRKKTEGANGASFGSENERRRAKYAIGSHGLTTTNLKAPLLDGKACVERSWGLSASD